MTATTTMDDIVVSAVPYKPFEDEADDPDDLPPPYQHPQVDVSSGWKDIGFGVAFWIQAAFVVGVGLVLSASLLPSLFRGDLFKHPFSSADEPKVDLYVEIYAYALLGAAVTAGAVSFLSFFLLQICAAQMITCIFIIALLVEGTTVIVVQVLIGDKAGILPGIYLLVTLVYFYSVRKHIRFAEAHLKVGCAILRSHPSLLLVMLATILLSILWLFFCMLLTGGTLHTTVQHGISNSTGYKPALFCIVGFVSIVPWYWGVITLVNIAHFITACTVGHWWFGSRAGEQYRLSVSIKRAWTTSFGTICFGSLMEALIKAVRGSNRNRNRNRSASGSRREFFWSIVDCLLAILEGIIVFISEWSLTYAALTGQSLIESSRSLLKLLKARSWTMIVNDSLTRYGLASLNLIVSLLSAAAGAGIGFIAAHDLAEERTRIVVIAAVLSLLIGLLFSSVVTTILASCVRTVFVCFALNPAALGATHPEHLHTLTDVWHKLYPAEFAASGYADQYPQRTANIIV